VDPLAALGFLTADLEDRIRLASAYGSKSER
jgi:hypothetical protein